MVALVLVVSGLALTARVVWVGYGPQPDRVAGGITFLERALADGAANRMQALFPEGEYFTQVLTGLAEAGSARDAGAHDAAGRDMLLARARAHLAVADDPATLAVFGPGLVPEHGVFAAGWSLSLAVEIARTSGDAADLDRVRTGAETMSAALTGAPSPFLASYPGQFWPCDTVVAVSALADAADLLPESAAQRRTWSELVTKWRTRALDQVDPATGLLPHRVSPSGSMIIGPRGSSGTVIQAFWPAVVRASGPDAARTDDQWRRFTAAFVTREAGLVGIREYPHGTDGTGDVDSGPLLLGVSASASAVGLAAARAAGDTELEASLDREAELIGAPLTLPGAGTRYVLGVFPVGDAFLAWARTRPPVGGAAVPQTADRSPRPLWPAYALPGLVLAGLGVLVGRGRRRRRPAGLPGSVP